MDKNFKLTPEIAKGVKGKEILEIIKESGIPFLMVSGGELREGNNTLSVTQVGDNKIALLLDRDLTVQPARVLCSIDLSNHEGGVRQENPEYPDSFMVTAKMYGANPPSQIERLFGEFRLMNVSVERIVDFDSSPLLYESIPSIKSKTGRQMGTGAVTKPDASKSLDPADAEKYIKAIASATIKDIDRILNQIREEVGEEGLRKFLKNPNNYKKWEGINLEQRTDSRPAQSDSSQNPKRKTDELPAWDQKYDTGSFKPGNIAPLPRRVTIKPVSQEPMPPQRVPKRTAESELPTDIQEALKIIKIKEDELENPKYDELVSVRDSMRIELKFYLNKVTDHWLPKDATVVLEAVARSKYASSQSLARIFNNETEPDKKTQKTGLKRGGSLKIIELIKANPNSTEDTIAKANRLYDQIRRSED